MPFFFESLQDGTRIPVTRMDFGPGLYVSVCAGQLYIRWTPQAEHRSPPVLLNGTLRDARPEVHEPMWPGDELWIRGDKARRWRVVTP